MEPRVDLPQLSPEDRAVVVDAWRAEAMALLEHERAAATTGHRALVAILTVLAAAAAYGLGSSEPGASLILLAVPPALALIGTYLQQHEGDAIAIGWARRELEQALESQYGLPLLLFQTRVAPLRRIRPRMPSLALTMLTYLLAFVMITYFTWRYVPTVRTNGQPVVQHAAAIKVGAQLFTIVACIPLVLSAIENAWQIPRLARAEIAGAIANRLAPNAGAPKAGESIVTPRPGPTVAPTKAAPQESV